MKIFLQMNIIFLSMIIEALPFVLIGVLISGFIQSFITERWIARIMPKNHFLATLFGASVGLLFPSCECAIVPITKRLLFKGVPLHAGIAFMLAGPVINPIVLFSTYIAFGSSWRMVLLRGIFAFVVALVSAFVISFMFSEIPYRKKVAPVAATTDFVAPKVTEIKIGSIKNRLTHVFLHAIEDFFSIGKYLVIGAFIASAMQTFIPMQALLQLANNPVAASLVMMTLAFAIALCSEADAFIAASFRNTFSTGALSAFLVFGPMIDIKNVMLLLGTYRTKFVLILSITVGICTLLGSLLIGRLF